MATFGRVESRTAVAVTDLSNNQYHFLRNTSATQVNVSSLAIGAINNMVGVLQNKPISGAAATIGLTGQSKVVAGAAVTENTWLTTNSSGRAITATSGDLIGAVALESASADGEVITVLLNFPAITMASSNNG